MIALPFLNLVLRLSSLSARFALTLFIAKYLTLAELGLFGLLYSATAAGPALFGFGMNFFLNRELVSRSESHRLDLLRDRLLVSATTAATASLFALGISFILLDEHPKYFYFFAAIFTLETVCLDFHYSLLILKKPLFANSLLFIRSSVWVLPFIVAAYMDPAFRNLDTVLAFWLSGALFSIGLTIRFTRSWKWTSYNENGFETHWFKQVLRKNTLVYASDIGIVGTMFADRFVLSSSSDLQQVGIFVFFWSLANAIQILTNSAVSQIALPYILDAYNRLGVKGVRKIMHEKSIQALSLASAMSILIFFIVYMVLPLIGRGELSENMPLFAILLGSTTIRAISDVWSAGLYGIHRDKAWAISNLAGLFLSVVSSYFGIVYFGLIGLTTSIFIVSFLLLILRAHFLLSSEKRS
jgi:O-antigen/teichoic acid export membrane protein